MYFALFFYYFFCIIKWDFPPAATIKSRGEPLKMTKARSIRNGSKTHFMSCHKIQMISLQCIFKSKQGFICFFVLHNVSWITAPRHFNKSEVRWQNRRRLEAQNSLLGSHSAGWADHPDVWVETLSRLRTLSFAAMTNEEKKCHNSLLDINDPWHLKSKQLQLSSAADLRGGICAGWIMAKMKGL